MFHIEPTITQELTDRAVKILDAKYKAADLRTVDDNNYEHLTKVNKSKLLELVTEFKQLFDGTLGDWTKSPARLEVWHNYLPYRGRAHLIPKIHQDIFQKEVDRLEQLGVLKWDKAYEWGSPTFIIPKKQGIVRFLTDFREVNERLIQKPWPLPKISTRHSVIIDNVDKKLD